MAKKKGKAITLRLDGLLEERVSAVARKRGVTRSQVVRDALEKELGREKQGKELSAYDRLKPWIGCIDSSNMPGAPFTSDNASEQARELIVQKWEKRGVKRTR